MTNRTKELFEFAQMEPLLISEFVEQLRDMDNDELDHIEQVAQNILVATQLLGLPDNDEVEILSKVRYTDPPEDEAV